MLNTDNKTMPILEIQEEKTCSAIGISGQVNDLDQISKVFTILQKQKIPTLAFVKFTNFVELYLANDRYIFNSVKSSWKNTSLTYRITKIPILA